MGSALEETPVIERYSINRLCVCALQSASQMGFSTERRNSIRSYDSRTSFLRTLHSLCPLRCRTPMGAVLWNGTTSVSEAVEQSGAAVRRETLLTATCRGMSRVPRRISARVNSGTAPCAVMMAKLGTTGCVARPVVTSVVIVVCVGPAVRLCARHDIVQVGFVDNFTKSV